MIAQSNHATNNNAVLNKRRITYAHSNANEYSHGFNCWGTTLYVLNHADSLVWENCLTMQRWLNNNTHRIYRPRRPGDIVAVHDWGLEHTAVYLGKGKYFHKKGGCEAEVITLAEMRKTYQGRYTFLRLNEATR